MKSTLYQFFTSSLIIFIFVFAANAQNFGLNFELPETPLILDTLRNKIYANSIDSKLALQVHIFSEPDFDETPVAFSEALHKENSDTLRAIADLMLLITNSESTEVINVQNNGVARLQLGLRYLTLSTETPYHTFIQYYLRYNYFYAFTVTVAESDLERGVAYRDRLFDSIDFY